MAEEKKGHEIIDPKQFPVQSDTGKPEGDFIDFRISTPKQIIDWLLEGVVKLDPTDLVRNFTFAPIPCKICGKKPEEIVEPGEGLYVVAFLCCANGRGIRFFCRDHAQLLQDELIARGAEIVTPEQQQEMLDKLDHRFAVGD